VWKKFEENCPHNYTRRIKRSVKTSVGKRVSNLHWCPDCERFFNLVPFKLERVDLKVLENKERVVAPVIPINKPSPPSGQAANDSRTQLPSKLKK
jgi:hypothetical protein